MLKLSMREQKEILGGKKRYVVYWGGDYKEFTKLSEANKLKEKKIREGYYCFVKTYN